jgi:hypothetical protein
MNMSSSILSTKSADEQNCCDHRKADSVFRVKFCKEKATGGHRLELWLIAD